jgi:hypothetical protein
MGATTGLPVGAVLLLGDGESFARTLCWAWLVTMRGD